MLNDLQLQIIKWTIIIAVIIMVVIIAVALNQNTAMLMGLFLLAIIVGIYQHFKGRKDEFTI